jgi:hypothetical protein
MTSSQNKLKRPETQPVPERGFTGKSPLLSGMLAKRDQLIASTSILRLVSRTIANKQVKDRYLQKIHSLGTGISEARRSERISRMIHESMVDAEGAPETKREALEMALAKKGIHAEIISEKEAIHFAIFKLNYRGTERSVPFPKNVMEGDAVANFEKVLGTVGIVGSSQELMESRKKEIGSFRPPADPIEVDYEQLRKRKISYDGKIGDKLMQFTYYADGLNTSIAISGDLRNGELIAEIDRKIFEIHETFDVPLDAAVFEHQASEKPGLKVPHDEEVERIVNGLQKTMALGLDEKRMPGDYQDAVAELRASPEYTALRTLVDLSEEDGKEFADAFKQLDNPAHAMVRMLHPHYCAKDGELTEEGRQIVTDTLKFGEKGRVNINTAALVNIAKAYSLLTGQSTAGWSEEDLRNNHLGMMFTIRTKMKNLTGTLIFKPVSA